MLDVLGLLLTCLACARVWRLSQALLDLDLVPGFGLAQKRAYLEETFNAADTNGERGCTQEG